nr:16S rRNA (guanine(527)-N(7))-methyltransferase RsmG [Aurantimonas marianensis]
MARLDRYVALLTEWQRQINLVAPATIGDVWSRHIADSLVLERLLPPFQRCVDLGSGAGLPGLVVAAVRAEQGGIVDLVESNAKKAAFLRAVQRGLGLAGTVHAARIGDCGAALAAADLVTARALAPLPELLAFVAPHIGTSARCFFQKGRSHEQEINQAAAHWRFTMIKHESNVENGSAILEIGDIARR